MKKLLSATLLLIVVFISCKKSNTDAPPDEFPTSIVTKQQYNNTSFGVYKGVVIGSTGTIVLRINNGDTIVKAYLSINNTKDTLSTTQRLIGGQAIMNLNFTGSISSMTLSANADGSNAQINNLNITGHPNATALIIHENSTQQVRCYEGTFTGDYTGNVCFIKIGSLNNSDPFPLRYLSKFDIDVFSLNGVGIPDVDTSAAYSHYFYETTPGATIRNFNGKGKFNGNTFSGYWTGWWASVGAKRGTFSCTRTY